MLTKEQILEVLKANSSMLDGSVQPRNFVWVANDLLKLQEATPEGAVPEGAIPEGYITEECPPGYVAKEADGCTGCDFNTKSCDCHTRACASTERKDGKPVIFIRKEDAK